MKFAYSFKYVSMLNAVIQLLYFFFALTVDIMTNCSYTLDAPAGWLKARSFIRSAIAIPLGLYTCVTFWVLTWFNIAMLGDVGSNWMRHILFTSNPIILLFDVVFCAGESSKFVIALIVINTEWTFYFIWLHIIHYATDVWPIPFFKTRSLVIRLLLYVVAVLEEFALFVIGKLLNDVLWSDEFVARIPFLRSYVSAPPRFIYGNPSTDSVKYGKVLSGTESMFVDRPVKKKKTLPKRNK
ncbi:androgen-induced gene 1 protein-like [Cimex lectularius]|nr:androgen-induced gene 1 protein-like [Cimex lectularius]